MWAWPTRTVPDDFPLIVGEMLYQYRAALDGVVYQAAILESGKDPPPNEGGLQFPITVSRKDFDNAGRYIVPLSDYCRTFIEGIQPYNAPELPSDLVVFNYNRSLGILNDWARKDRHRKLHVVGSLATKSHFMIVVPDTARIVDIDFVINNAFMENTTKIASFRIEGHTPGMKVNANPNLSIDISLNEGPPKCAENDTFANRLRTMSKAVKIVIGGFEEFFSRQDISPSAAS
jgi:hypothetical protein